MILTRLSDKIDLMEAPRLVGQAFPNKTIVQLDEEYFMSVNKSKLAKSIMDRGQWSPQPNELWSMPISVKAKSAYCYLLAQSDTWNPGLKGIATGISMSVNSARAAIKELEDANMITVEQSPNGLRNIYTFTGVNEWNCQAASDSALAPVQSKEGHHINGCTGTVSPVARIQEESNTNLILTTNTKKYRVEVRENSFKEEEEEVEYKVPYSPWRLHYLKSPAYEVAFDNLSPEEQSRAYAIKDKEDFLTFLEAYRRVNQKPINLDNFTLDDI